MITNMGSSDNGTGKRRKEAVGKEALSELKRTDWVVELLIAPTKPLDRSAVCLVFVSPSGIIGIQTGRAEG